MASYAISDFNNDYIQVLIDGSIQKLLKKKYVFIRFSEPYIYLKYHNSEVRSGSYTLKINYTDVTSPAEANASDLKDAIDAMLANTGSLTFVSVDGVTITGDGTPGDPLVAVVSGGSAGTELTPELFADGNVTGIGADQFLDDLGYTDGTAAAAWPLTAANYPGGLTAAGFTLDTVAWQELFFYVESTGASYMGTSVDYANDDVNKTYYVNKTLYLPRDQTAVASNRRSLSFLIDFKGARVRNSSGGDMILFDRYPVDQDDADALVSYQYCFWNGIIRGNGGTDEDDTLFRVGATSRCEFKNMNCESAGRIVDFQFCLEPIFDNVNISDYGEYGLMVHNGQWSGAGFFNAQSNVPRFGAVRSYNSPGNTPIAAVYCNGNHSISGGVFTFEGDVGSEHHFLYDNDGTAGVQLGKIEAIYMEFAGCDRAAIRVRAGKGQFEIGTFRSSVDESDMPVLIEVDNDRTPTSSVHITIRNSAFSAIGSKLRAVGDPDYPIYWSVYNVRMNDNVKLNVAANFETGVIANSYIPDDDHVSFAPPIDIRDVLLSSHIIGHSGTVSSTNTTAEEILWSVLIPGGTLSVGDAVTAVFGQNKVAGAGTNGVRVRLHTSNAVGGTEYYLLGMTGTTKRLETVTILMTGSSAQIGNPATGLSFGQFGIAFGSSALDLANDMWVIFTSQKSVGTDTHRLEFAYVEIKKKR